jgi:hypothetical protein
LHKDWIGLGAEKDVCFSLYMFVATDLAKSGISKVNELYDVSESGSNSRDKREMKMTFTK